MFGIFDNHRPSEFRAVFLDVSKGFDEIWHSGLKGVFGKTPYKVIVINDFKNGLPKVLLSVFSYLLYIITKNLKM